MLWAGDSPVPKLAGKLTLDVLLPENSELGPRVMRCRTEVTRVAHRTAGGHEVALRVLSMRFVKPGAGKSPARSEPSGKRSIPGVRHLASMPVATERVI